MQWIHYISNQTSEGKSHTSQASFSIGWEVELSKNAPNRVVLETKTNSQSPNYPIEHQNIDDIRNKGFKMKTPIHND